jgi:hypothetical protein
MLAIFHKKRTPRQKLKRLGTVGDYHLTWEKKTLPNAGAGQYSFETYGLPPFPRDGNGNIHVENPLRETYPAAYAFQNVGIVGVPPSGVLQGQLTTQPLMDPAIAEAAAIVLPGAVPNSVSFNGIVMGAQASLNP